MEENPYKAPIEAREPSDWWRFFRMYAAILLFVGMVIFNVVMARMGRGIAVFFR